MPSVVGNLANRRETLIDAGYSLRPTGPIAYRCFRPVEFVHAGKHLLSWTARLLTMRSNTMPRIYQLVKPVRAFQQDIGKVVTIPAGAKVELVGMAGQIGMQNARWEGHPIMAYEQDLALSSITTAPNESRA